MLTSDLTSMPFEMEEMVDDGWGIFRRFLEGRVVFAGKTVKSLLIYIYIFLTTDIKTCHLFHTGRQFADD